MPWKKTEPMNERIKFIAEYLEKELSITELCERFCISRKTGYKWIDRYDEEGAEGLKDQSRAPHAHPHAVPEETVKLLLALREKHPLWGPKKLLVVLKRQNPRLILPVASTAGEILKKNGLIKKRRTRYLSSSHSVGLREYAFANSVWCADFKGSFPVDGKRCSPLTISDGYSRYLIRCKALDSSTTTPSKKVFESAFREFGLPDVIRTDNGVPFSSLAPGGLSTLAIWWIKLGIKPERIEPGRPDQNGRHERMHRTLKAETAKPPRDNFRAQQRAFDLFREEYNHVRPHEALMQEVPASFYKPSLKKMPNKIKDPEYPSHFEVFKTYPNGLITVNSTQWMISGCLKSEWVGLEQIDNDCWKVYFAHLPLGIIDLRNNIERKHRHFGYMVRFDGTTSKKNRTR